ncbi:MAG: amino acid adenylation domain-containing protein, partial [Bacteroidales bacterium]|nr:amino acid adenylation domain-containing protein [Bacteroidales bacterium]
FDVMFNLLEGEFQEEKDSSKEELKHIQGISKFDLSLTALDLGSVIRLSFEYSTKLFRTESINRFISYFKHLLKDLPDNFGRYIKDINIIPEEEKKQILYDFNDTETDYLKNKCIHELFEEQVERTPNSDALIIGGRHISYREFNTMCNRLALVLVELGVYSESIVSLQIDRSVEMMVGIMGILKAGGTYLPIDSEAPEKRVNYILNDSNSKVLLLHKDKKKGNNYNLPVLAIDLDQTAKKELLNLGKTTNAQKLSYVIYTSGSTGEPKGVMIEHHSVINRLKWMQNSYPIGSNDILIQKTPYTFDVSVWELFWWSFEGSSLFLLEKGGEKDPLKIASSISENKVSIIHFVPSMLDVFLDYLIEHKNVAWLDSLRFVFASGEELKVRHVEKFYEIFGTDSRCLLVNLYGPTEATVDVTYFNCNQDQYNSIPIGKPIANTQVYILNRENRQLQAIGVVGELCLSGVGLSRGYLGMEELTSEKFIDHPYKKGEKLYRTGDLARWLDDGNIEFLGRIDDQVKIRGFRIELGEIENTLLRYKNIKESVVLVWGQGEDKYLCAYVVVEEVFNKEEIRNYLSEHLPNYMIPTYFVALEKIPLTRNGKIDKKSLLAPEIKAGSDYVAPNNLIETKLVKIWSEVLNIATKEISTNVSFFELGGHSLKATVLVSRIHKELDVRLELRDIFQYQTIQVQSELINSSESSSYFSIPKAKKQDYYPLSSSQRRLYLLQQMDLGSTAYNMPGLLAVPKGQDKNQIKEVFNKLIARHENFRTSFEFEDEIPVQRIHSEVAFSIKEYQIKKSELSNIKEDFVKAFDLNLAPLLRVGYLEISDGDDMLLIDMHHIISDGRSYAILEENFSQLLAGKELEALHLQYKDYSQWQNSKEQQERIKVQESYWLDKFTGELPILELPTDNSRPVMQSFEGASVSFVLSAEETKIIHDLCKGQGLTLYMSLLSVFTILLSKLSGQEDIIVGSPIAARRHSDLEDIVGMFVNTLALRNEVSGDKCLIDYLQELKENTLEAYENQEYQFEDLVEMLVVNRDTSRNPIFDVMFNLLEIDSEDFQEIKEGESIHEDWVSKFDLSLSALDSGSSVQLSFQYSTKLFKSETIDRFISYFKQIINQLPEKLNEKLSELEIITEAEKQQLLYDFNDTKRDYPRDKTIHQLFEEQVERTLLKNALIFEQEGLSYYDLNQKSNQIAHYLRNNGVTRNSVVALIFEPSHEMIICLLGVLKSGACYLPINLELPNDRISYILSDSESSLILTNNSSYNENPFNINLIHINDNFFNKESGNPECINTVADPIYVIYTSGTTGKPKGVILKHENLINYTSWFNNFKQLGHEEKTVLTTSYSFDLGYTSIYSSLVNGYELHLLPKELYLSTRDFNRYIIDNKISYLKTTPSLYSSMVDCDLFAMAIKNLKLLLLGGESINTYVVEKTISLNEDIQIINHYGPTEATIGCITYPISKENLNSFLDRPVIGNPIHNTNAYIVDESVNLLPIGVAGELCISGEGLAQGYLNNLSLTDEKFISHPFKNGEKLYRTGDLARWLPEGNVEFLGRIDNQVKIRGYRIELEEISNVLKAHENIEECEVLAREENRDKYLCAYLVTEEDLKEEELRTYLSESLPDYMIPSYFVELDKIPLTSNGKVDRKSLPVPEIKAGSGYVAPQTLIETKLVKIWSEVLNVASKEISTNANFFELGGHSLKATVLVSRIHKELDVRIELREVFQFQTILAQSKLINSSENISYFSIPKAKTQEYYSLSSSQRRLYLLQQMDLGSTAYNMPGLLAVPKGQNKHQITAVFNKLIARHENFRTSFEVENEFPVQRIHSEVSFSIKSYQITNTELSNVRENFVHAFDLSHAPLLRVAYLEISDGDDMLFVDMHHIISDGKSHSILEEEFYQLLVGKELEPLRLQYKDYSEWQNSSGQQERIKEQESYWLDKFTDELPVLELPVDYPRPVMQSFEGASVRFVLPPEETAMIHDICREQGLTLYMSLLSVFTILLSKLSGQEDIIVGSPIAARRHSDLEDIVGMFVNTLAIRSDVSGDKQLIDYLQELKENTLEAYENQEYQFEDLVEKLVVNRDTSRNPLFDVMFNLLEGEFQEVKDSSKEELKHIQGISKFDLSLTALNLESELQLNIEYSTKLFRPETIERFIGYFKELVKSFSGNSVQTISELNILTEAEKQQLLYEFNDTRTDYPSDKSVYQLFEESARRFPKNIAVSTKNQSITYTDLWNRSDKLAKIIRSKGIHSGRVIGLMLDRSIEMIVGLMGVLKSGCCYLPLMPDMPISRFEYIMAESECNLVLTQTKYQEKLTTHIEIINLDVLESIPCFQQQKDVTRQPNDLAYIIYTSGTTGQPKGVPIENHSVVNRIMWMQKEYPIELNDVVMQKTPYTFDVSVWELFWWSFIGASVFMLEPEGEKDPVIIANTIDEHKINVMHFVPSMLEAFFNVISEDSPEFNLGSMKYVFSSGEVLKANQVKGFYDLFKENINTKLVNLYGPTEATVDVSYFECKRGIDFQNIPIGKPIDNIQLYILDKNTLNAKAIGVVGELMISGVGLSRGYLKQEKLTSEKFIEHPFIKGGRLYRTGDLTRWLPDGNIEFFGRIDSQVKIRGFRIELGEIESSILKYSGVKECVVLCREDQRGEKYLCAYVVIKSQENKVEQALRIYLSGLLPDYMIPTYFVELAKIPLTSNGKIDRKSLPTPEIKAGSSYEAPKTLIETKLIKIWSEVLAIASKEISTTVSFFELGGHSLKATVLVSRIHKELDVRLELREVFQYPTVQGQAELINSSESISYFSIPKARIEEYYPLSSSQRRLYLLQQMDLGSTAYNMPGLIAVPEGHEKYQIEDAFNQLISQHENFRTSFEVEDGLPVQRIHSEVSFWIDKYKITNAELSNVRKNFVQAFDLSLAPLLRVAYVEISDGDDMLLIDMHHIISDGKSHAILEEEFNQLIEGKELEPLRLQYKDYSQWQNSLEQQERIKGQEAYWLDKFTDELPVLELPTDYSRPVIQSFEGARVGFILSAEETVIIQDICREQGLTLYMSLLSVFTILLSKLSGQEDIIVGSPIAARRHADLDVIVGMFVNTLTIRNDVSGDKCLIDYLQDLKENTLEAYENQEYQFEDLVDLVVKNRDTSHNPLFDVMFNLLEGGLQEGQDSTERNLNHKKGVSKFDLSLTALKLGSELQLSFEYSTKLFRPETIERFIGHFKELVKSFSGNSVQTISELNILTESEKQQLLYDFNDTRTDYPKDKTIYHLFEEQVESTPDIVALVHNDQVITYLEFSKKVNIIANILQENGVRNDDIVGICYKQSINFIIGIISISKLGGCFIPLSLKTPEARLNYTIKDSNMKVLLSNEKIKQNHDLCTVLIIDDLIKNKNFSTQIKTKSKQGENKYSYIIYTSGSTGIPKGVLVNTQSLVNLCWGHINKFEINKKDHISKYADMSFDASIWEIFPGLIIGASLYIIPDDCKLDIAKMNEFFEERDITISFLPTQICEQFIKYNNTSLRILLTGGDKLRTFINTSYELYNNYGPTENTVLATRFKVEKKYKNIPIGKNVENTRTYILDKWNNIQPIGVAGEIGLSGDGLMIGYLNNQELTNKKLILNPFEKEELLYKTGDLARWLPDGNIEFLDRLDNQVKIRGFRIELGEIENCLLKHSALKDTIVISREDNTGEKYICAYVIPKKKGVNLEEILRSHILKFLPDYMLPSYFIMMDTFSLLLNGKINKKILPDPDLKYNKEFITPSNEIEEKLSNIWSNILNISKEKISTDANFFELGGSSLKVTSLVYQIHKEFNIKIPFQEVFSNPSIIKLAKIVSLISINVEEINSDSEDIEVLL